MYSTNNLSLVACRRCESISDILVRAQLPQPISSNNPRHLPRSFRCQKHSCNTCPYIEHGRDQYMFYSTGKTYEIKSHISCDTYNVIYMIQCTKCNLQCIGETKRRLKDCFNEHRRPFINPPGYNPTAVSKHFLASDHVINDHMILIPLQQLYTKRDSIRKAREAFLIQLGKTLEPAGVNKRDEI